MNTGGLIIMLVSVGTVTLFFTWCLYRILTAPSPSPEAKDFPLGDLSKKKSDLPPRS
jgi:hypothetical protein